MDFSQLYQQYGGLREPGYTLTVDGAELTPGRDARLLGLACELTCSLRAGFLWLEAALDPDGEQGGAWLDAFQLGAVCALSLGYGAARTEVFRGFVYDVSRSDPLRGGDVGLEAVCLDARGALMLSSRADAGAGRTLSQLVGGILEQSCCTRLAGTRTVADPPEGWDLPARRLGESDYEVVCAAARLLCYEFYAFADGLYFGPPRPDSSPCLSFDGPNGLIELRRRRTLAGQCAAVAVSGADGRGQRVYARHSRARDSGFGAGQMAQALSLDLHQPVDAVRTMAQAQYLAQARMEERQRRTGGVSGRCAGLPELRPGRFVALSGLDRETNGPYYVRTVRHTLDEQGFETFFEAEE